MRLELTAADMLTPRYRRATRFANEMLGILRDFIPQSRDVNRLVYEHLVEVGWRHNIEMLSVPEACDAMDRAELEHRMITMHPVFIRAKESGPLKDFPAEPGEQHAKST